MALKLLDVNVLLYAHTTQAVEHSAAREWFEHEVRSGENIGIPEQCIHSFLRISTNKKLDRHTTMSLAIEIVRSWLERPNIVVVGPGPLHWSILFKLLQRSGATGTDVTDAQIAALALEYDGVVYSTDRDFGRYGIRWVNPLSPDQR